MSSKPIYPHVPYFYIIEHVASGKRYAGSRWAKGCNPAEFMTEGGYCTSSTTIKKIIEEEGLSTFVVVEIKTIDEVGDVYDYETEFLVENDCAKSEQWLNRHNNTGMSFGTEEFKEKQINTMLSRYGVENASQSETVKEKKIQTCLKNHGVEHALQSETVKEKKIQTCLKNHGVEHALQSEEVQEKSRQTMLKNHGVEHALQSDVFKEKTRLTNLERHGFEYASQSEEVKEKTRLTNLERYGFEHVLQSEEVKEKCKQTNLDRYGYEYSLQSEKVRETGRQTMLKNYGVEYALQSEEVREKYRQTMLKNHGVENYSQTKESKERASKLNYERFDFRINNEILNGDFSRFVYLYDNVDNVFLMGIEKCLNRGLKTSRYIKVKSSEK
jgi:hypothetical protein